MLEFAQGRILVFIVEDGKLQLVTEKEAKGAVYNLNAFNGKLLAGINQKIQLYKWTLREDGARELQYESSHHGHILALYVQSRGDFIVVGDLMKSISLLIYKVEFFSYLCRPTFIPYLLKCPALGCLKIYFVTKLDLALHLCNFDNL